MQSRILLALSLATIGSLSATGASLASSHSAVGSSATAACSLSQLTVSATWAQTNAHLPGGGAVQGRVSFRNAGKQACALTGFLQIQLVDGAGKIVAVPNKHTGQAGAPVLLRPNRASRATSGFNWLNWCKGALHAPIKLRIALPNQRGTLLLSNTNRSATGSNAASCVNPTSGSVLVVDPYLKTP